MKLASTLLMLLVDCLKPFLVEYTVMALMLVSHPTRTMLLGELGRTHASHPQKKWLNPSILDHNSGQSLVRYLFNAWRFGAYLPTNYGKYIFLKEPKIDPVNICLFLSYEYDFLRCPDAISGSQGWVCFPCVQTWQGRKFQGRAAGAAERSNLADAEGFP